MKQLPAALIFLLFALGALSGAATNAVWPPLERVADQIVECVYLR